MPTLRRLFPRIDWDACLRMPTSRLIALLLVVIVPGGLVVPLFCGIYGAIRHTLSGNVASRGVAEAATVATSSDELPLR